MAAELLNQRLRQLVEGVGDDHDLPHGPQSGQEFTRTQERLDAVRYLLQLPELDATRPDRIHPPVHELGKIAEIPRGQ